MQYMHTYNVNHLAAISSRSCETAVFKQCWLTETATMQVPTQLAPAYTCVCVCACTGSLLINSPCVPMQNCISRDQLGLSASSRHDARRV
jgi:hypothetical protein